MTPELQTRKVDLFHPSESMRKNRQERFNPLVRAATFGALALTLFGFGAKAMENHTETKPHEETFSDKVAASISHEDLASNDAHVIGTAKVEQDSNLTAAIEHKAAELGHPYNLAEAKDTISLTIAANLAEKALHPNGVTQPGDEVALYLDDVDGDGQNEVLAKAIIPPSNK